MISAGSLEHARLIARAAGTYFNPECDRCVARTEGDRLLGGVIFTGYKVASIGLHAAGFDPRWINNDMLWITFHYPFEQLDVVTLIATTPSRNHKALEFNRKLGFKEMTRVTDAFPDGDLLILSMRREDCRWLKLKPRGAQYGRQS